MGKSSESHLKLKIFTRPKRSHACNSSFSFFFVYQSLVLLSCTQLHQQYLLHMYTLFTVPLPTFHTSVKFHLYCSHSSYTHKPTLAWLYITHVVLSLHTLLITKQMHAMCQTLYEIVLATCHNAMHLSSILYFHCMQTKVQATSAIPSLRISLLPHT